MAFNGEVDWVIHTMLSAIAYGVKHSLPIGASAQETGMDEIRFVAATGAVGAGVDRESLAAALERGPQFIAADAGTTDAGPVRWGPAFPPSPRTRSRRT